MEEEGAEAELAEAELAEAELAEEELHSQLTKGTSANKEPYQRNSKEIAPKRKNSLKTYEVTFV